MADDGDEEERESLEVTPPPIAPSSPSGSPSGGAGGSDFAAPEIQTTSGTSGGGGSGGAGGSDFAAPEIQTTSGRSTNAGTSGGDGADAGTTAGGGVGDESGDGYAHDGDEPKAFTLLKVGAAILVLIVVIGVIALVRNRGDQKATRTATVGQPASKTDTGAATDSGSAAAAAPPANTVLDSCFQVNNLGSSTDIVPTFLLLPVAPGQYSVILTTGVGPLSGSATAAPGATFVVVTVHFTAFTTISAIAITGPGGSIDPGTFSKIVPFELNAQTDKATDCDGSKLKAPETTSGAAPSADVTQKITAFLDGLSSNLRAGDVDGAVAKLDPVVLQFHTADECRATISTFTDPTSAFAVKSVDGSKPFDYTSGGQTATVPAVFSVDVTQTRNGQGLDETIHVSRSTDGGLHWFTSCESAAN